MAAGFDPDMSGFAEHPDAFIKTASHDTSHVYMTTQEKHEFEKHLKAAHALHEKHPEMYGAMQGGIHEHFKTYINKNVREGTDFSMDGLADHIKQKYQTKYPISQISQFVKLFYQIVIKNIKYQTK